MVKRVICVVGPQYCPQPDIHLDIDISEDKSSSFVEQLDVYMSGGSIFGININYS